MLFPIIGFSWKVSQKSLRYWTIAGTENTIVSHTAAMNAKRDWLIRGHVALGKCNVSRRPTRILE